MKSEGGLEYDRGQEEVEEEVRGELGEDLALLVLSQTFETLNLAMLALLGNTWQNLAIPDNT